MTRSSAAAALVSALLLTQHVSAMIDIDEEGLERSLKSGKNGMATLDGFERTISSLGETPIKYWTGAQWLCLAIVVFVAFFLFNCLCSCCCYRRRRGYYYVPASGSYYGGYPRGSYYGNNGGGGWSCSNIFWCLCCFEWCCRDCRDVDNLRNSIGNVYQGAAEMVV